MYIFSVETDDSLHVVMFLFVDYEQPLTKQYIPSFASSLIVTLKVAFIIAGVHDEAEFVQLNI